MSISSASLSRLGATMSRVQRTLAAVEALQISAVQALADQAADAVSRRAAQAMTAEYQASGVGRSEGYTPTGTLRDLVARSQVTARVYPSGSISLSVRMPDQAASYKGGKSAYTVAGAVNYGSVRSPKEGGKALLGEKAKRTVKMAATGGNLSDARQRALARKGIKVTRGGELDFGGRKVTVVPPKKFYALDSGHEQELIEAFNREFEALLIQYIGG